MSKIELEKRIIELEAILSKATYMIENFMDLYDLDSEIGGSINDAILFAYNKPGMLASMSIIHDYIFMAKNKIKKLEEGVMHE